MKQHDFVIIPLSESALTIELGSPPGQKKSQSIEAIRQQLFQLKLKGIFDIIPAYTNLSIIYDFSIWRKAGPTESPFQNLSSLIKKKIKPPGTFNTKPKEIKEIPVCYDPEYGPDLKEASKTLGLSQDELIHLHFQKEYTVFMIGFLPGFPYMGKTDKKIQIPRKSTPRTKVPKGSIAIADFQTGIYPFESPGGWNLIGRTPIELIKMEEEFKSYLESGDRVRFHPIDKEEFNVIREEHSWG